MVDWLSEKVEAVCQDVYVRFVSFLLGVFLWVLSSTSSVRISMLNGV